ncbi:MAG: OmpA family protein, partial [Octadecabacter sp.]
TQPLIVTQGQERRNRRTVTEVSGFIQSHPTVMNGQYGEIIFRDYVGTGVSAALGPRDTTDLGNSNALPGGE